MLKNVDININEVKRWQNIMANQPPPPCSGRVGLLAWKFNLRKAFSQEQILNRKKASKTLIACSIIFLLQGHLHTCMYLDISFKVLAAFWSLNLTLICKAATLFDMQEWLKKRVYTVELLKLKKYEAVDFYCWINASMMGSEARKQKIIYFGCHFCCSTLYVGRILCRVSLERWV